MAKTNGRSNFMSQFKILMEISGEVLIFDDIR